MHCVKWVQSLKSLKRCMLHWLINNFSSSQQSVLFPISLLLGFLSEYPFSLWEERQGGSYHLRGVSVEDEVYRTLTKSPQCLQNIRNLLPELIEQINLHQNGFQTKLGYSVLFFLDFSSLICCRVGSPVLAGTGRYSPENCQERNQSSFYQFLSKTVHTGELRTAFTLLLMRFPPNWRLWKKV